MPFEVTIEKIADIDALSPARVRKALDERSSVLHNIFTEAGEEMDASKVKSQSFKDGGDMAIYIRKMNEELSALGKRQTDLDMLEKSKTETEQWRDYMKSPEGAKGNDFKPGTENKETQTVPWAFKAIHTTREGKRSAVYEAMLSKATAHFSLDDVDPAEFLGRKATFLTSAGWAPESLRTGRVVLDEQREIEVTDVMPLLPTSMAAIVYMEETTFTNAAAERSENAAYAESTLALTEMSQTVRSVGTSLPVTDEQLADEAGVRAYLDQRLGFMVRQRLDTQILQGTGIAPLLLGTYNVVGIGVQAKGADATPDAIYKAIDVVKVTGRALANVCIVHPNDWQAVRLLKTADGIYIWGPPMDAGPQRIWGLPVIATTAATEGTGLVGDYARFSGLHIRQGLDIQTGYVNDDFLDGRVTIRAGLRCAIVHYRPSAFCSITGI